MRLYRYLTELFQEKKDFEVKKKSSSKFIAEFKVEGNLYVFNASAGIDSSGTYTWEAGFIDKEGEIQPTGLAKETAIEVYSYVISIIKYFIREYKPESIGFESSSPKQKKLYGKLLKRYEKEIEKMGYEIESDDDLMFINRKE